MSARVSERRRAAQLARHYRDQENLTIAEIARRLGRAEATVKAYLYDPFYANPKLRLNMVARCPVSRAFRGFGGVWLLAT